MQIGSVFPGTSQWNYSQFRLQLILSHPNIQIISISKNPNIQSFVNEKQNYFKIDAAIDATQLNDDQANSYKNNIKKNSIFKCGRIPQEFNYLDGLGNVKTYRMILFKIAVKQVLSIYQSKALTREDLSQNTNEYDSIYISTKRQEMTVYNHQYFLKSTNNYIWQYDIQYRYINPLEPASRVKKWLPEQQKCQQCQTNKAIWYCIDEKFLFCRECYEDTHKGKNRLTHKKQVISPFNCHKKCDKAAHNRNILEFYCFNCKSLKCTKCISDINHSGLNKTSSGSQKGSLNRQSSQLKTKKGTHDFTQVRQLIEIFKERQGQLNNELKTKLTQKLKQIEGTIAALTRKYDQKLHQLQRSLTQQIINLKQVSRRQINRAVSIHIQLKRKFDEILWIQKFVNYNQQILDAQSNINLKQSYSAYVQYMNAQEYFRKIDKKLKDMKL